MTQSQLLHNMIRDTHPMAKNPREYYKAVADNTMPLQYRDRSLSMIVVVVFDEVFVRHAILLLDVYCGLDHFSETSRVRITCLKSLRYHDVVRRGLTLMGNCRPRWR
jgi:hypothetical protein